MSKRLCNPSSAASRHLLPREKAVANSAPSPWGEGGAKRRVRGGVAISLIFFAAGTVRADFNSLLRVVERQPGMHRVWTPGISLARLAVRIVHPEGVHDFQLVVFEGSGRFDGRDFEAILRTSGDQPMVQVHSKRTGETAVIWARPVGSDLVEMVLLAHDPNDNTVVLRAVINGETLAREISDPRHAPQITQR